MSDTDTPRACEIQLPRLQAKIEGSQVLGGIGLGGHEDSRRFSAGDVSPQTSMFAMLPADGASSDLLSGAMQYFGCCGTQAPNGNRQMRVELFAKNTGALQGTIGSETDPASSCGSLLNQGHPTGTYWIGYSGLSFRTYCDMDTLDGGWTMLMKAGLGDTFQYDSPHWTTASTLNPDDATRAEGDAKFWSFNTMECTEIIASWPDAPLRPFVWRTGTMSPVTALQLFQTPRILSLTPMQDPNWNADMFSHQDGMQLFAINHADPVHASVRWGYSWNNEADWSSNDVSDTDI